MAKVPGTDLTHVYNVPVVHERTRDPLPIDDVAEGYCVGDEWYTPTALFKSLSVAPGAAVWARAAGGRTAAMWTVGLLGADLPGDDTYRPLALGPGTLEGNGALVAILPDGDGLEIITTAAVVMVKLWTEFTAASNRASTRIAIEVERNGVSQEWGENGIYSAIAQTSLDRYALAGDMFRPVARCASGDALTLLATSYMTVLVLEAPPPGGRRR